MDFLIQTAWYSIELHGHAMAFHGTASVLQGTPWHSMELHDIPWNFMAFHGTPSLLHGTPWNSMDTPWEFRGISWISIDFHGIPWISIDFHGFPWISMDFHGISSRYLTRVRAPVPKTTLSLEKQAGVSIHCLKSNHD